MPDDQNTFSGEFKLSITRALADQLLARLADLEPTALSVDNLERLESRPGIYELFLRTGENVERVYVGKASKSLPTRLRKHHYKLSGRSGIDLEDVLFQCLYVDEDLEASAPEKMLINRYRDHDVVPWNTNGFGNNDPGRRRDRSLVKANHFDALYPADLGHAIDPPPLTPGEYAVSKYLAAVKKSLPFNLRFESKTVAAKELADTNVSVSGAPRDLREILGQVIGALPEGWQATALPGYVICYHESASYDSAREIWRKEDGQVIVTQGPDLRDAAGEIDEEDSDDEE